MPTLGFQLEGAGEDSVTDARPTYVFLAGIGNSEAAHWQSRWSRSLEPAVWVEHADWDCPSRDAWVEDLNRALESIEGRKLVIAHSLGCLSLAEWARDHSDAGLAGALLVAPPDVGGASFPEQAEGWRPAFENPMPVTSVIVASHDDPYASFGYSRRLAEHWSARLVDAGDCGHINLMSELGDWPDGRRLLQELLASIEEG